MRILFFGDGLWATLSLQQLIEDGWDIAGLVVRLKPTDPTLISLAKKVGLMIYQPERVNETSFLSTINSLKPDLNISVSYDQILYRLIRESSKLGFVNFHAGKLPFYRGRNVVNWAIINGETEIGLTAHYVDNGIDTGDIILQHSIPINWEDQYDQVLERLALAFPGLVLETVRLIADGKAPRIPQAHMPGTYYTERGEGDEWLDWSNSSRNLYNKIRAITHPGPGARSFLNDQIVIIWKAYYDPIWPAYNATPGQVVSSKRGEGVVIKTGDSTLLIQQIQIKDGIEIPNWRIGTRLGINVYSSIYQLQRRVKNLENRLLSSLE